VSAAASTFRQVLPDLNHIWGEEMQRISDPFIGLASCDPLEDVVLFSSRNVEVTLFAPLRSHA
jgi:hypothetical protein